MAIHRFRVHGILAQVENPDRIIEERRQSNFGFPRWKQREGSGNWFHFPVPTPNKVDDDQVNELFQIFLHVHRDTGVEVQEIHARTGFDLDGRGVIKEPAIPADAPFLLEVGDHRNQLNIHRHGALCISVLVRWESNGYIRFYEAGGAWFS